MEDDLEKSDRGDQDESTKGALITPIAAFHLEVGHISMRSISSLITDPGLLMGLRQQSQNKMRMAQAKRVL
jgi:hypothetical protein